MPNSRLPIHGFVLAGGQSTRMGQDKAMLHFDGRPLIELAVSKLRTFCIGVSIAGNRDDLSTFAPVVHESRVGLGPAAGICAGLKASLQPWTMFIPVDVPLVPAELLRGWAKRAIEESQSGFFVFHLFHEQDQPAFCLLETGLANQVCAAVDDGERKLVPLFQKVGAGRYRRLEVSGLGSASSPESSARWFTNINTPDELAEAAETLEANTRAVDTQEIIESGKG